MLRDVLQHLDLAKRCANSGKVDRALAHAAIVTPEHRLRVKVDCSNLATSEQSLYRNALNGAFRMWEEALGQKVFEVTETGTPDVLVHFKTDVKDQGMEVCGHSQWTRGVLNPETNPTVVFTGDVQVSMRKPGGQLLTFEQIRACAAHELGHILGLDDSCKAGDLMGRMDFNRPALTIRADEVESLVKAREEASTIRRNFTYRLLKLKQ